MEIKEQLLDLLKKLSKEHKVLVPKLIF